MDDCRPGGDGGCAGASRMCCDRRPWLLRTLLRLASSRLALTGCPGPIAVFAGRNRAGKGQGGGMGGGSGSDNNNSNSNSNSNGNSNSNTVTIPIRSVLPPRSAPS